MAINLKFIAHIAIKTFKKCSKVCFSNLYDPRIRSTYLLFVYPFTLFQILLLSIPFQIYCHEAAKFNLYPTEDWHVNI